MKKMLNEIVGLLQSEDGQGMVEYGLIIGLVAVALILGLTTFKDAISGVFTRAGTALNGTAPTGGGT